MCLVDLPTGGGKSLLGSWVLRNAKGRGVYVCPTKKLQTQIIKESKTWTGWVGEVVCLFGRQNYWCDEKLDTLISDSTTSDTTQRILQNMQTSYEQDDSVPPRDFFCEECDQEAYTVEETDALWEKVSSPCECCRITTERLKEEGASMEQICNHIREEGCEYDKRRYRARQCKMLVLNAAQFFAFIAFNTDEINFVEDTFVIDEGHLLADHTESLLKLRPTNFDLKAAIETVNQYRSDSIASGILELTKTIPTEDDLLVFQSESFCAQLGRCKNKLDHANLKNATHFLRESKSHLEVKESIDDPEIEHGKILGENQSETELLLQKWKSAMSILSISESFKATLCELTGCIPSTISPSETRRILNEAPMTTLKEVARNTPALQSIIDLLVPDSETTSTLTEVYSKLHRIDQLYYDLNVLQLAANYDTWSAHTSNRDYVPTLKRDGTVEYSPTIGLIARRIREEVWDQVQTRVLVLSATLINLQDLNDPFRTIRAQLGINVAAELHMDQVFDRNRIRILSPKMPKWNSKADQDTKNEYRNQQANAIQREVSNVRDGNKSVLVLGPSANEEADEMYERLKGKCQGWVHIHAKKHTRLLREFCDGKLGHAIIYGGNSEATGMDLPGRLGLVVITRPPNPQLFHPRIEYHRLQANKRLYWNLYTFKRDQLALQAAGRLQRKNTDEGTVLFLGEGTPPSAKRQKTTSQVVNMAWQRTKSVDRG